MISSGVVCSGCDEGGDVLLPDAQTPALYQVVINRLFVVPEGLIGNPDFKTLTTGFPIEEFGNDTSFDSNLVLVQCCDERCHLAISVSHFVGRSLTTSAAPV
jgi:hypothetical protein